MIPAWLTAKNGSVFLNDLKRFIKGGVLTCDTAFVPLVIAAAPSATVPTFGPPIVVEGPQDAVSEIFSFLGEHDATVLADVQNRMRVLVTDVSWRRRLMNRSILVNHLFGVNLQPAFVDETPVLRGQQTLIFEFANASTLGVTGFRFAMETRKFQATSLSRPQVTQYLAQSERDKLFKTPYWLTSPDDIVIPAAGVVDVFFQASADIYLLILANIATFISTGVAGDIVEGFTVEFFDAATERPLQNQPIARSCCSGSAGFPFVLPTGWMIEPNRLIHVRFTNLITDQPITIFWTFKGVAVYEASSTFGAQQVAMPYASSSHVGVP